MCKLHNIRQCLIFAAIIFSLSFKSLLSQAYNGGYAESYLQRNIGTRPIALAGAYTAISNDPFAIFYNPAGLGSLTTETNISTMYSALQFGRTHSSICWGQALNGNIGIGAGINCFSTSSFTARDIRGNPTGSISNSQIAVSCGAAYNIEYASAGIAVKYLNNSLLGSDAKAEGFAFDLGMKFNVAELFTFGISVQNLDGRMYWNTQSGENSIIPYTIRAGIAMEEGFDEAEQVSRSTVTGESALINVPSTRYLLWGFDVIFSQYDKDPTVVFGGEIVPDEIFAVRAGIALAGDREGSFELFPMTAWGVGLSIRPVLESLPFRTSIEYSISPDYISSSGLAHHIALSFAF